MSSAFLVEAYPASNARHLSPSKVAESFVANSHFDSLLEPGHTLLVGPRGSGKTTLLKMLTQPALRKWRSPRAKSVRASLPFVGVYVPADIVWQGQIDAARGDSAGKAARIVTQALMATNLFKSFAEALHDRMEHSMRSNVTNVQIEALWTAARSLFGLEGVPGSAGGIVSGLGDRFSELSNLLVEAGRGLEITQLPGYCHVDPIPALGALLDRCGNWFIDPAETWALCFDELEILDEWLRDDLIDLLRSTDQRFIFKLSVAPFRGAHDNVDSIHATLGHDYSVITLWYPRPSAGGARKFSHEIATAVLSRSLGRTTDPSWLLGVSAFATSGRDEDMATYEPGSNFWVALTDLAEEDDSLNRVLKDRGIDLASGAAPSVKERNEFFRKIKPSVLQRREFRKLAGTEPMRRSRKHSQLYSGFDMLQCMCEGNPRWLIGVLKDLLREWGESPASGHGTGTSEESGIHIPSDVQARVLDRASRRYADFLRNWPAPLADVCEPWPSSLFQLVERIGRAFFDRQVLGDFPRDPKGSFVVDEGIPEGLLPLIQQGVIQGAFVDLQNPSDLPSSPRGRRYRLSFLLSPSFRLTHRVLKAEKLHTLITRPGTPDNDVDPRQQTFLDD